MTKFIRNETFSKQNFIHVYSEISEDDLNTKINELFLSSGYKLTEGKLGNATYVRGNRVLRILFGAFSKYFKFKTETIANNSGELIVEVKKATSGMSGGLIGVSQVKKELKRLEEILRLV